jgi:hypothetical protein
LFSRASQGFAISNILFYEVARPRQATSLAKLSKQR